jgi:hypothetical protein
MILEFGFRIADFKTLRGFVLLVNASDVRHTQWENPQ